MKKIISLLLVCVMLSMSGVSAFALEEKQMYEFEFPDGKKVNYYLDENQMPYRLIDGEVVYVALPLEHLKVTEPLKIAKLNAGQAESQSEKSGNQGAPTYYFDLSTGPASRNSISYTQPISFLNVTSMSTMNLKFHPQHQSIRIKTTNLVKEHFWSGVKIDFTYYYYYESNKEWCYLNFTNINCTIADGFGFQHQPNIHTFGRFDIIKNSGLQSFDVEIWTSFTWSY